MPLKKELAEKFENEIYDYGHTILKMNPSFAPLQKDILELIDHYWMSKFRDGEYDDSGWRRAFYNIVENPTLVTSKMIDFDTKDVRIISEEGQSYLPAWFFQRELKVWMKENNIGKLLNDIVFNLPKYGHIVLKKVDSKLELVNLLNVIINPTVKEIKNNPVIEKHLYTESELEYFGKELHWENVENVLSKEPEEDGKYIIYERFDPLEDGKNYHIFSFIRGGEGEVEGIEVLKEVRISNPYREHKWEDIAGRWLGRGSVEKLFENQIASNEGENMFRKGLLWTSKHVFQSRDENVRKNLMTEIDNGEVMTIRSEVTPIAMEERNLAAYNYADQKWESNTDKRTFSFDVVRGERTPAGTPLGSAVLQSQMAGSFFELKREELGLFLKDLILNDIIPEFKKQRKGKHIFHLLGDQNEIEKIDNIVLNERMNERIMQTIMRKKYYPSSQEIQLMRLFETSSLQKTEGRYMEIPESFYDDLKYKVDVLITSEQIDVASKLATLQTVFQILGSNPAVLQDKRTKKVFFKLLEMSGINPEDLEIEEANQENQGIVQTLQRGGSTARVPQQSSAPTRLPVSQNV